MASFHSLTIKDIRKETTDTVSIAFDIPSQLNADFTYEAGQYISIDAEINGEKVRRSYSLSSFLDTDQEHRIAVKQIENGKMSTFLNQSVSVGEALTVSTPEGHFKPDLSKAANYALFAAGSGITPIISIVKAVLAKTVHQVTLFYGNRNEQSIIFESELKELKAQYPDRFDLHFIFSRPNGEVDALHTGRIDPKKATALLKAHVDLGVDNEFFMCGPTEMMKAVEVALESARVSKEMIHVEYFSSPASEEDEKEVAAFEGTCEATVVLDDEEYTVEIPEGKSVLDAVVEADIDAPYSCRGAVCSSCIAKVEDGAVDMKLNYVLTEDEIEEGLVLTCQSFPKTAKLKIDFDA